MSDPLKGKRAQIRAGELDHLNWPDDGNGCPVEVGEVFALRNCHIEITSVKRVQKGKGESSEWVWLAFFDTYHTERPYLLSSRGYTTSPHQALKAQDDEHRFASQEVDGQPPEPEGVPPHEIGTYTGDRDARHRYLLAIAEARAAHEALPLEQRLASVVRAADEQHIDISKDAQVIKQRLSAMERKVFDKEAA